MILFFKKDWTYNYVYLVSGWKIKFKIDFGYTLTGFTLENCIYN